MMEKTESSLTRPIKEINHDKLNAHLHKIQQIWNKKHNTAKYRSGAKSFITRREIEGEYLPREQRLEQVNYFKSSHFRLGFQPGKYIFPSFNNTHY